MAALRHLALSESAGAASSDGPKTNGFPTQGFKPRPGPGPEVQLA